jgi:uncharacterized protein YndB with AHSA1/START domain
LDDYRCAGQQTFVITRTFDAPRDRLWKAWTERDRLRQWFTPKGFKMTTATLDLRPGGMFHYCMRLADGKEMWGKFVYRVINAPERIGVVNAFSNEAGGLARHPMSPIWPREMLSTFTLAGRQDDRHDRVDSTEEERKNFDGTHDGMKQGWTGTFDQLAEY